MLDQEDNPITSEYQKTLEHPETDQSAESANMIEIGDPNDPLIMSGALVEGPEAEAAVRERAEAYDRTTMEQYSARRAAELQYEADIRAAVERSMATGVPDEEAPDGDVPDDEAPVWRGRGSDAMRS